MIKTTFFLAIVSPGHTMLSRTIEIPFRVSAGDEVAINDDCWLSIVASVRFNLVTLALEANLTDYEANSEATREELKAELTSLGWKIDFVTA